MFERLMTRSFLLAVAALVSVHWLTLCEQISGEVYLGALTVTVGAYITRSIMQDKAKP